MSNQLIIIMDIIQTKISELNKEIVDAHDKYYKDCSTGLWKPNESPNGNPMFHLYSDGEVIYQKGGWAYGQRSFFSFRQPVSGIVKLGFKFPNTYGDIKKTYVILTEEECYEFREKMLNIYNEYYII